MCQLCVSVKAGSGRTDDIPILVPCVSVKSGSGSVNDGSGSGSAGEIPILILNSIHISNRRANNIMIADACYERTGSGEIELMAFPCDSKPLHVLVMLKF